MTEGDGQTTLGCDAKVEIGGKLAQLGSRLVQGTGRLLSAKVFTKFAGTLNDEEAA